MNKYTNIIAAELEWRDPQARYRAKIVRLGCHPGVDSRIAFQRRWSAQRIRRSRSG